MKKKSNKKLTLEGAIKQCEKDLVLLEKIKKNLSDVKKLKQHMKSPSKITDKKPKRIKSKTIANPVVVEIIESERGWGMKVDSIKKFPNREKAIAFCNDFNKGNNKDVVPDWYMVARIRGEW